MGILNKISNLLRTEEQNNSDNDSCSKLEQNWQEAITQADNFFRSGDMAASEKQFQEAIKLSAKLPAGDKRKAISYHNFAYFLFTSKEFAQATSLFEKAIEFYEFANDREPYELANCYHFLAKACYYNTKLEKAEKYMNLALRSISPKDPEGEELTLSALSDLSIIYLNQSKIESALTTLDQAISIAEKNFPDQVSDLIQRKKEIEEKINSAPEVIELINTAKEIYKQNNNCKKALSLILEASKIDPESLPIKFELAKMLVNAKKVNDAISVFSDILLATPNDWKTLKELGHLFMLHKQEHACAIEYFQKAITLNPQLKHIYYPLGICYQNIQEYSNSTEAFKNYLQVYPNDSEALQYIGENYAAQEAFKESLDFYFRSFKLEPENKILPELIISSFIELDDIQSAIDFINLNPSIKKQTRIKTQLANLHSKNGENEIAIELVIPLAKKGANDLSLLLSNSDNEELISKAKEDLDYYLNLLSGFGLSNLELTNQIPALATREIFPKEK